MRKPAATDTDARWEIISKQAALVRKRLRPLACAIDFSSVAPDSPFIESMLTLRDAFSRDEQSLDKLSQSIIPTKLRPYLLIFDEHGIAKRVRDDRYEWWLYHQLKKRVASGELYLNGSIRYRSFNDELVPLERRSF